ncbi:MAG: hypothetical protein HGB11_01535 [Chlorobiales bacterium]|nr:hypothetical protein [Chlorobiales bacterium]
MQNKLRLDSLRAELNSVKELLQQAIAVKDPIGELQYEHRKNVLVKEIQDIEASTTTRANLALFFGGKPVLGSKGISAEFAGKVLEKFQDLVTRTFASKELGRLGNRGPIPQRSSAKLMVTELARGSFGFVLDEMSEQLDHQETPLKSMVDEVARIIEKAGSSKEPDFEEVVEYLNQRTLTALRDFFCILENNESTVRIVDDKRDFILDQQAVHRGYSRINDTSIDENEDVIYGKILGVLPESRRFEFEITGGSSIQGSISEEAVEQYRNMIESRMDIFRADQGVKLLIRTVKQLNRQPKDVYHLTEFVIPEEKNLNP